MHRIYFRCKKINIIKFSTKFSPSLVFCVLPLLCVSPAIEASGSYSELSFLKFVLLVLHRSSFSGQLHNSCLMAYLSQIFQAAFAITGLCTVDVWLILPKTLHPEKVRQNSGPCIVHPSSSHPVTVRIFTNRIGAELACGSVNKKIFEGVTDQDHHQPRKVQSFQLQQNGP